MAHNVGVDLCKSIDTIDYKTNLIKSVEQARVDLWINNNSVKPSTPIVEVRPLVELGEYKLEELLNGVDDSENEIEDKNGNHLRHPFSNKKEKNKVKTSHNSGGKFVVAIKGFEQSVKKKRHK